MYEIVSILDVIVGHQLLLLCLNFRLLHLWWIFWCGVVALEPTRKLVERKTDVECQSLGNVSSCILEMRSCFVVWVPTLAQLNVAVEQFGLSQSGVQQIFL